MDAITNKVKFYKGFNTKNYESNGSEMSVYDIDCVKQDLINDIFTIKGERLMMPNEGTRIPLMVFEPNDIISQNIIREDISDVIDRDPRVDLIDLDIIPVKEKHAIIAVARITYKEFKVTEDLRIEINSK